MSLSTWSGGVVIEYEVNTTREISNRRAEADPGRRTLRLCGSQKYYVP